MHRALEGRVAIVAGAGPGIGRSTALAFANDGASVAIAARRAAPLAALAKEIEAESGQRVLPVPCDIGEAGQRSALVAATQDAFGRIDALVNVASAASPRGAIADMDWDGYLETAGFIVAATMDLAARCARVMARNEDGGAILNIGALSSTTLIPKLGRYTTTKAAMVAASKTMAREVGAAGIRVNVVTPGFTTGAALDQMFEQMAQRGGKDAAELKARAAKEAALGRHVDPEDIAEACLFLASPRGRNITGVELHVNAGQHIA